MFSPATAPSAPYELSGGRCQVAAGGVGQASFGCVNRVDPSGNETLTEAVAVPVLLGILQNLAYHHGLQPVRFAWQDANDGRSAKHSRSALRIRCLNFIFVRLEYHQLIRQTRLNTPCIPDVAERAVYRVHIAEF